MGGRWWRSTSLLFLPPALSRLDSSEHTLPHVSGVMIIVNEDHEKQDTDSGLFIRPPDRVARRRRSLSTLPDYEASEAQYSRRLINKNTKVWHQTKLWRAILFSLLTYALLTVVIGVPIIVKKMKKTSDSDPWNVSNLLVNQLDFSLATGAVRHRDNQSCNIWTSMTSLHSIRSFSATLEIQLPATGNVSVRSNATLVSENVVGTFTAEYDPNISDNNVHMTVNLRTTSLTLRDSTLICYDNVGEDRGLEIFIPNNISSIDSISVDIHVVFPMLKNKDSISNFNVYLPAFSHSFKDLSHLEFQRVYIEGAARPINITSIRASCISVKNILGNISGTYNASKSLIIDTVRGAINASITLLKSTSCMSPTHLSLETGDRDINAQIILVSPGGSSSTPQFAGKVTNFNAEVNLRVSNDPSTPPLPMYFSVQNNMANTTVIMDQKFEGTFLAQTKLDSVLVVKGNENRKYDDLYGSGRQRTLSLDQPISDSSTSGWVGWGQKPALPIGQSRVEISSSLGPVTLAFGPT